MAVQLQQEVRAMRPLLVAFIILSLLIILNEAILGVMEEIRRPAIRPATQSATQPVKVSEEAVQERIATARRAIGKYEIQLVLHQDLHKRQICSLGPAVSNAPSNWYVISSSQASKLIDVLVDTGFFQRAKAVDMADPQYATPTLSIRVHQGGGFYEAAINFGKPAEELLIKLRQAVADETPAAVAIDDLLRTIRNPTSTQSTTFRRNDAKK